eukprot:6922350-Prymnesium_polylepis.1
MVCRFQNPAGIRTALCAASAVMLRCASSCNRCCTVVGYAQWWRVCPMVVLDLACDDGQVDASQVVLVDAREVVQTSVAKERTRMMAKVDGAGEDERLDADGLSGHVSWVLLALAGEEIPQTLVVTFDHEEGAAEDVERLLER